MKDRRFTKQEVERLAVSTEFELIDLKRAATELFTYADWDEAQKLQGANVRRDLQQAYETIVKNVAPGPTRTRALNMLLDCRMVANAAITFPGE